MKCFFFPCLFVFSLPLAAQDIFSQADPSGIVLVEVRERRPSAQNPWQIDRIETRSVPGIFCGRNRVLAGNIRAASAIDVRIRQGDDLLPAVILKYDTELNLVVLEARQGIIRGRAARTSASHLGQERHSLEIIQANTNGRLTSGIGHMAGYGAAPSPGNRQQSAALLIESESAVPAGSLLLQKNVVRGVAMPVANGRLVAFIPGPFIHSFARSRNAGKPPVVQVHDYYGTSSNSARSVVMSSGFTVHSTLSGESREFYGLHGSQSGVIVDEVFPFQSAATVLEKGDIILAANGQRIGPDGLLSDSILGKIPLSAALVLRKGQLRSSGQKVYLQIRRGNHVRNVSLRLSAFAPENLRVPVNQPVKPYYILAGLLLLELEQDRASLSTGLQHAASAEKYNHARKKSRVVYVERVLPGSASEPLEQAIVQSINGVAVQNLQALYYEAEQRRKNNETIVLVLSGNQRIVLDSAELTEIDRRVRERNGISFLSGNLSPLP